MAWKKKAWLESESKNRPFEFGGATIFAKNENSAKKAVHSIFSLEASSKRRQRLDKRMGL